MSMGGTREAYDAALRVGRWLVRRGQGVFHLVVVRPWRTVALGAAEWVRVGVLWRATVAPRPACTRPAGRMTARPVLGVKEASLRRAGGLPTEDG